jgi:hypothetical protein
MGAEMTASGLDLACTKLVQEPAKNAKPTAKAAKLSVLIPIYNPQNPRVNPEIRRR